MSAFAEKFDDLRVFQLAYQTALAIHPWSLTLPKSEQFGGMADQLRRCSKGICANLAEGFGKNSSRAEFRRFTLIALGSANECLLWLKFCQDLGLLTSDMYQKWMVDYQQICRMLQSLAHSKT